MRQLLILITTAVLLAACSSTRTLTAPDGERPADMTASCSYKLTVGKKSHKVKGALKMRRDEIIQMSFTMLGFELMRIEFTPERLLIVNRMNKQYIEDTYDNVDLARTNGLDFNTAQALFWGEPVEMASKSLGMKYSKHNGQMPTKMRLSLLTDGNALGIEMSLSRIKTNTGRAVRHTSVDRDNYRAVPANCAINAIMSL